MSHLGRRLSALIDGELSDSERDQAHAHLVGCDECRAEAAALRTLKRRVRGLGETPADGALTRRLIALGGLPDQAPPRPPRPGTRAQSPFPGGAPGPQAWHGVQEWFTGGPARGGESLLDSPPLGGGRGRGHARYMVAGAVALAVSLGAAAFAAGGGEHLPGPTVTPEVDVYMMQHAVNTGLTPLVPPARPVRP